MPIKVDPETFRKLKRMVELQAVLNTEPNDPHAHPDESEEYRTLLPDLVEDFMPIVDMLRRAGVIIVSIGDKTGEYVPNYEHVEWNVDSVWENGAMVLQVGNEIAGSSLPRHKPGREPLLYTWNTMDGYHGEPTRPITTWTGKLLDVACLAGGEGWSEGYKPKSVLVVQVTSTREHEQTSQEYDFFFEHYRSWEVPDFQIAEGHKLIAFRFDGGVKACWSYNILLGRPRRRNRKGRENMVDYLIYDVCRHHTKEMRRLRRLWKQERNT